MEEQKNVTITEVKPDGGRRALLQVFSSFFLWFNTWCVPPLCLLSYTYETHQLINVNRGLVNAYGAWQTYYVRTPSPLLLP